MLVGLGVDAELTDDRLDVGGVGGDEVDRRRAAVAAAAGRLAVERQVAGIAGAEAGADPAGDGRLEGGDVDAAEDAGVGGLAEAAAAGEPQQLEERPAAFLAVLDDGLVAGLAGEHGDDGQGEEGVQGMPLAPGAARIINPPKQFHQGAVGVHARTLI